MAMEASEVAVRVRLLGGTAFEKQAQDVAKSVEEIGAAGKSANLGSAVGGGATVAATKVKSLEDRLSSLGKKFTSIGMGLAPLSAGLAYLGVQASKASTSFNASMMQLYTQANMPRKQIQGLTKDVQNLATVVGQTPQNLSTGLFNIVSSGVHNSAKAMSILKTTGMMAGIGGDTVTSASDSLMSLFNTHLKGGGSPQQLAAYIEAAIGSGKVHMDQINGSMTTGILPMLKRTGTDLPSFLASMAALTREGVPAQQFASRMRLTMTSVMSPTAMALKAFQQLGLKPGELAGDLSQPGHILTMLQDLQTHAAALPGGARGAMANNLIAQIFGKSRGMGNIAGLLDTLPQMQGIYSDVLGATPKLLQQHWKAYQSTPQYREGQAKAAWNNALITLGNTINLNILPVLTKVALWFGRLVTDFGKLNPHLQKIITLAGLAVVVLSPLLIALGGLLRAVSGIMGAYKSAAKWVRAMGTNAEIAAGQETIAGDAASASAFSFRTFGKNLGLAALRLGAFATVLYTIPQMFNKAKSAVHTVGDALSGAGGKVVKDLVGGGTAGFNLWGGVMNHGGILGGLKQTAHSLFGWIPGLATGGIVSAGGLTMVGEKGPELLSLPRGAQVTPLPGNALSDLRYQFGDGAGTIHVTVNTVLDSKVLATSVAQVNRKNQNRK